MLFWGILFKAVNQVLIEAVKPGQTGGNINFESGNGGDEADQTLAMIIIQLISLHCLAITNMVSEEGFKRCHRLFKFVSIADTRRRTAHKLMRSAVSYTHLTLPTN